MTKENRYLGDDVPVGPCDPSRLLERGSVDISGLCQKCLRVEFKKVGNVTVLYHYFPEDCLDDIMAHACVLSRARCWTYDQMLASLATDDPHYGDGTYCTLHHDLYGACPEVQRAHGGAVAYRRYRAVFLVRDPEAFHKVRRTGGVVIAKVPPGQAIHPGVAIVLGGPGDGRAEFIAIEYRDDRGRWVTVLPRVAR